MNKEDYIRVSFEDGMVLEGRVSYIGVEHFTLNSRYTVYFSVDNDYTIDVLQEAHPEPPVGSIGNIRNTTFVRVETDDPHHWLVINDWRPGREADSWKYLCDNGVSIKYWNS